MNSYVSIYVPRMSTIWSEDDIKIIMSRKGLGTVTHVDFTPINKKPGFGENVDTVVMSAFIHFNNPVKCIYGEFWTAISQGQSYKLQITSNEYWICLKNKNPIKRTRMNIHQVVENGRYLENLIMEQAEEIKYLKEKVEILTTKVLQSNDQKNYGVL